MRRAKDGCGRGGCSMTNMSCGRDEFFLWVHGGGVGDCRRGGGMGFLLWVICGLMVVKVGGGGCRGDGGSVAMGFGAEVSGVAVGWWRRHEFRWLRFLGLPW
nr:hypothetical protein CFP56_04759 [Quercus suber]